MSASILNAYPYPPGPGPRQDLRFQAMVIDRPAWGQSLSCQRGQHKDKGPYLGCGYSYDWCLCECHDDQGGGGLEREDDPSAPLLPELVEADR